MTSFLSLFPLGALAMPFMFLAFFAVTAMATMHAVAEEMHCYKHDEDEYREPVFP